MLQAVAPRFELHVRLHGHVYWPRRSSLPILFPLLSLPARSHLIVSRLLVRFYWLVQLVPSSLQRGYPLCEPRGIPRICFRLLLRFPPHFLQVFSQLFNLFLHRGLRDDPRSNDLLKGWGRGMVVVVENGIGTSLHLNIPIAVGFLDVG